MKANLSLLRWAVLFTFSALCLRTTAAPPVVIQQPLSYSVCTGAVAVFFATVQSDLPATYQWQKGGAPISGATNVNLVLPNVQPQDAGAYSVLVSSAAGSASSDSGQLTVHAPPAGVTPGALDTSTAWQTGLGADIWVSAAVLQPDGKLVIGGDFQSIHGLPRKYLARLNADGTVDLGFNPDYGIEPEMLALQGDGKIIVAGYLGYVISGADRGLVRLNTDGTRDTSFAIVQLSGSLSYGSMVLQPDGNILIGADFASVNGSTTHSNLARITSTGTLDTTFTPAVNNEVMAVALQDDGKIVLSGYFSTVNGTARAGIARLLATGATDTSFNPGSGFPMLYGFVQPPYTLAIQPDGKIIAAGGYFIGYNGANVTNLIRLTSNGGLDSSFQTPALNGQVVHALELPDGNILISGYFTTVGAVTNFGLAKLTANGSPILSFNFASYTNFQFNSTVPILGADCIYALGGNMDLVGPYGRGYLARFRLADGALDQTWYPGKGASRGGIFSMALQADGKIVVGGAFESFNGQAAAGLTRLNPDATIDPTFLSGLHVGDEVFNVTLLPDQRLLVLGAFTNYNGQACAGLVRLLTDGTIDPTFSIGSGPFNFSVPSLQHTTLARQADGRLLVAGWFDTFNGQSRNGLVRLLADGAVDSGFVPQLNIVSISAVLPLPDGSVIIGDQYGMYNRPLIRLGPDGHHDTNFLNSTLYDVASLALQPDGKILVGIDGSDTSIWPGHLPVIRLLPGGSPDPSFSPVWTNGDLDVSSALTFVVQADGRILLGGFFREEHDTSGGTLMYGHEVIRIEADGSLDHSFQMADETAWEGSSSAINVIATRSLVPTTDGSLIIGGGFSDMDGIGRNAIARLAYEPVFTQVLADLSLSVSTAPQYPQFYSNLVYTITVSNAGPSAATGVVVSNQIPTKDGLPSLNFISASDGSTPTNGVLLMNLGSLAAGATDSIQITGQITTNLYIFSGKSAFAWFTNVFQVFANQTDPVPTNNTDAVGVSFAIGLTTYTTSTRTIETNLTAVVSQQATNYSTELIARLPDGTVVYDQTFNAPYSDATVQSAITTAAGDLTGAGATSYTGPTQTNFLQTLTGSSSVTVTNTIGSDTSFLTTLYIGPQTIMVSANQSEAFFVQAGDQDYDTLATSEVTNLVTTTSTSTYLNSAQYVLTGTGGQAQADLSLSVSNSWVPNPNAFNSIKTGNTGALPNATGGGGTGFMGYFIMVSNAGPSAATGVVVSNQSPASFISGGIGYDVNFVSATGGATPTNGVLLVPLGSLAVGATNGIEIVMQIITNGISYPKNEALTNVFQVFADQTDPDPTNNSATVLAMISTSTYTTSTENYDTNLTATVNRQATNYSTELIAKLPNGTVVYDQTFNAAYSDPTVQGAVSLAAAALANAGAASYTGPTETNALQSLTSSNSVTATNAIGTNIPVSVTTYIGPQTIMVGDNQSFPYYIFPGGVDYDTLVISVVTNLVTTTNTSVYTNSSEYVMTGTVAQADLSLIARAAPQPVGVGSNLVYTLEVINNGPAAATGIILSNQIPATAAFVSATGGGVTPPGGGPKPTNSVLLINIGPLPTNTATFASITVQPLIAGQLTNWFTLFGDQADPALTNNSATVVSTVTNPPPASVDVALSLTAAPNPVDVGAPLTYSLTVTNNSSITATGVVVTNTLPPNVTLISVLPSQGSTSNQTGVVTYFVGSLTNATAATLAIVVVPNAAGLLTNTATASSAQADSQPANNSVTNVTTAVSVPITNLVLTVLSSITLNPQTGLFEQRIEVANGGPATPSSVLVLISGLPANAKLYNATGITNGTPFVQSAAPLGVGSNVVFLLEYYVPTRVAPANLTLTVEAGPVVIPPVASGTILNISRTIVQPDGSVLVEFSAVPGQIYAIQYSSDMQTWQTAVPAITAPANRVQWIDSGPPKTVSSPAQQSARYYRVVLLTAL
jgi:uncharacterized delta-60 repeat protein/uncharacterized repeat protein (TIGR01451 family)